MLNLADVTICDVPAERSGQISSVATWGDIVKSRYFRLCGGHDRGASGVGCLRVLPAAAVKGYIREMVGDFYAIPENLFFLYISTTKAKNSRVEWSSVERSLTGCLVELVCLGWSSDFEVYPQVTLSELEGECFLGELIVDCTYRECEGGDVK